MATFVANRMPVSQFELSPCVIPVYRFDLMIVVDGLCKKFPSRGGGTLAVDAVSFRCQPGEIYGLLGTNGAGKTTTLRMLATLLRPTAGRASIAGIDLVADPQRIRNQIGFLSTATALYGRLTAEEMILYFGRLHNMGESLLRQRTEMLIETLGMQAFRHQRCERCSTGMKQKISIARSLVHDPSVMILDEPTLGLDVMASRQILEFIRSCRDAGKTVLFSTHVMREVEKLCDRVALIQDGRICAEGTVAELRARYRQSDMEEVFVRATGLEPDPEAQIGEII